MNKQTVQLLEHHFDTAFAAPDGIKKLRELILGLAMQGKLVSQDPQDQPASELLKEIEAEKRRLAKAGKIKAVSREDAKNAKEIKPEEVPYELPKGWEWARLGDVVLTITGGGTPSKNNPAFWGGGIPWASVKDLNVDVYLESTIDSITEIAAKSSSTNIIPKGNTIVCTRMGLGKIAINKVDIAINQDLKALTVSSHVDQMFFFKKYKNYKITGSGMTVHGIRQDELLNFLFPLPPLPEQHRIVAKIDQLMARCDELEKLRAEREQKRFAVHTAALKQLLDEAVKPSFAPSRLRVSNFFSQHFNELYSVKENVAELRKAILQLAVMGKLVPQDSKDQPASELLQEIELEKKRLVKAGKIKVPKPLPEIKEVPYELPKGWEWVRFEEIVEITSGVTKGRKLTGKKVISLPYLRVANVQRGYLALEKIKHIEITEDEIEKFQLKPGDLLITEGGDWDKVGRTAIWGAEIQPCIHQNHIFKARCLLTTQNAQWMEKYLNSTVARDYFADASKQTTNLASINKTQLRGCPIPMPPLAEQQRIVAKIDQLMAHCDELDKQIDAATGQQTALLNAVMSQV